MHDNTIESPWLTYEQAAAYLGTTHVTLRAWVHQGRLRAHRASRRIIRFHRDDLDALMQPTAVGVNA